MSPVSSAEAPGPTAGRPAEAPREALLRRLELGVGLALVLALALVHLAVLRNSGALWRDEVSSVNVARLPTFAEMVRQHHWDSFPILWCSVLRGWMGLGLGASDLGLRALGTLVGLGLVLALWWTARRLGLRVPLVSLLLLGLSPTVFRHGDGVRGYGLAALLLLVMLGAIWSLVREPSPRRALLALAACLLGVQSLYANSPMLLALCTAGAAVCCRRRAWKALAWLAGIGLVALVSMLPYLLVLRSHAEWSMIVRSPIDLAWIGSRLAEALDASGGSMHRVWIALGVITLAACALRLSGRGASEADKDLALFTAAALLAGLTCFTLYLQALSVTTQPWYYLPVLVLAALAFEVGIDLLVRASTAGRVVRLAGVVLGGLAVSGEVREAVRLRNTSVDGIAERLARLADEDDLIVVDPWYAGITFARYYHGPTPWMVVPDLDVRRFQPYGALKERMAQANPIARELERVASTLRSGRRVWLAGGLLPVRPGEPPGDLPPAPLGPRGWWEVPYTSLWSRQLAYLVRTRAQRLVEVPLPTRGPVSAREDLPLAVAEGWR